MVSEVYTPASIQSYINSCTSDALISTFFGLFCIFVILRYSSSTIDSEYHFHLLNITVWTLICDLITSISCRPYPIFPTNGVCGVGAFNEWAMTWMQVDVMLKLGVVSVFKCWVNSKVIF
jgi:hypothetical protein